MSCSEDRSIKLWDLAKGFSLRSMPCAKMPNCLAIAKDGAVIITGAAICFLYSVMED